MSDREQFDAWFDKEYPISGDCGRIKYRESSVSELMIAAWQASRRAALEEAIRATSQAMTTSHACDAIRALAEGDRAKQPTRD